MATKTTRSPRTTKAKVEEVKPVEPEVIQEEASAPEPVKPVVPKDIDLNQYITVKNGFQGKLVYKSNRTGEIFIWESFGDEQEIELRELKDAKNSKKKMFINNWFMFDEDWVIDYLGLRNYYKHTLDMEDFDSIFELSPEELEKKISEMSKGQKSTISYRARQLILDGEIDSIKKIEALEKALGVEITEK